jgi:excisionase family DNA binding protein
VLSFGTYGALQLDMGRNGRSGSAKVRPHRAAPRPTPTDKRSGLHVGPAWVTVSQLSHRWQLARKTIYKLIDAKSLPAWKVGSRLYRVAVDDVLRFEAQKRRPPK